MDIIPRPRRHTFNPQYTGSTLAIQAFTKLRDAAKTADSSMDWRQQSLNIFVDTDCTLKELGSACAMLGLALEVAHEVWKVKAEFDTLNRRNSQVFIKAESLGWRVVK